jgi:Spy/CpxP family protein refolding chaperone
MNSRIVLSTLALSLAVGLAQAPPRPRPTAPPAPPQTGMRMAGPDPMARRLGLTEAQQKQLQEIRTKADLPARQKAAQEARRAFAEAAATEGAANLRALHQAMADHQLDLMLANRTQQQAIHALLTPEQREKAAFARGLQQGRGGRPQGRPGMGGQMGMGQGRMRQGQVGMGRGMGMGQPGQMGMGPGRMGQGGRMGVGQGMGMAPGMGLRGRPQMRAQLLRRLDLTPEQRRSLQDLQAKFRTERPGLAKPLREAREAFRTAAAKPETKPEALKALHQTLTDRQFEVMTATRAHRDAMGKLLTPEQREKLATLRGRMMGRLQGRQPGPMGQGPQGPQGPRGRMAPPVRE